MKISIEQLAAAQGFEPRHAGPEPAVLPLDDAANKKTPKDFIPPGLSMLIA